MAAIDIDNIARNIAAKVIEILNPELERLKYMRPVARWQRVENEGNACTWCRQLNKDDFYRYNYCSGCGAYMENGVQNDEC